MFGLIGKLVTLPIRIAAAPIHAVEDVMSGGPTQPENRILSMPLDKVADAIEETTEEMDE